MQSEKSMVAYMADIMKKALELRENAASNRYRNVLDEVMNYIEKHYAEEYKRAGYFAAINKGTLFAYAIDGKETGSFTL